jgi:hypothetical protein
MDSGLIAEQAITSTPLLLKGPSLLKGCPQSTQGASSSHSAEKFTKAQIRNEACIVCYIF